MLRVFSCLSLFPKRPLASKPAAPVHKFAPPQTLEEKGAHVRRLLAAKEKSGMSFSEIARRCEITNGYCAQLFFARARLDDETASTLKRVVPALSDDLLSQMKHCPLRIFDERLSQDPTVYRFHEAINQYGEAIKAIINEEFGDGIMSAIGLYVTVEKVTGAEGEARVMVTFNGKFLPHIVQKLELIKQVEKDKSAE